MAIRIHTSISSATAIKPVGEVLITAKWKETAKQTSKERAVIIPMECVQAPEVPESFRALVESVLLSSAESVLKNFVNSEPNSMEMDSEAFTRPELVSQFMLKSDSWMSKEELEVGFTMSATWKRIASKPEFTSNKQYQIAAQMFKDTILKLTGKAVQLSADKCDAILAKLEDADLETDVGAFIVKRLTSLREKQAQEFDLSAL